jgi:hypothetical protein
MRNDTNIHPLTYRAAEVATLWSCGQSNVFAVRPGTDRALAWRCYR